MVGGAGAKNFGASPDFIAVDDDGRLRAVGPTRFDIPDLDHWSRHYPIEARKVRGLTEPTLADAVSVARTFVDPILAGTATGSWDPATLRWRRP